MNALFGSLLVFPKEIAVFQRERGAKAYRVSSYFLGKSVADIPFQLLFPLIFGIIAYWMVGLNSTFSHFLFFLFVNMLVVLTAQCKYCSYNLGLAL